MGFANTRSIYSMEIFWVCGDQLLKGAALNAVQIAERILNWIVAAVYDRRYMLDW